MEAIRHSPEEFLNSIEGATIASGEIHNDEGVTLYLLDGRALVFVSDSFYMILKRISNAGLH